MSRELLTGNHAAALAARLADVDYVPAFPITPQTEIIETLFKWNAASAWTGRMVMLDSEHSMITAAGTAAALGARVFTASSSQGLLYGLEMVYAVAGTRVPLVLANVSRGIASPITLESDHTDVMSTRDTGALQLHCATCQEVLDLTLMAFRLSEHPLVRLPVIVNLDGFYLSFTREPVHVPSQEAVSAFLPPLPSPSLVKDPALAQGVAVLGGGAYSYFRYEMHLASQKALEVWPEISADFAARIGRSYPVLHNVAMEDAEIAFVMIGSFSTKAEQVVETLRQRGQKVGLVRPRFVRPFPGSALRDALENVRAVICIDQNLSIGSGGVLATELSGALYDLPTRPLLLRYVGGLGGRDIRDEELVQMVREAEQAIANGKAPPPRLLYTEAELRELRKLQALAGARATEGERS